VTEQAKPTVDIPALVNLLKQASPEVLSELRGAMGASGVVTRQPNQMNNADAKRIAYTVGESIHPDGFVPKPSEALEMTLGKDEAQRVVAERFLRNQNAPGAMSTLSGRDAERATPQNEVGPIFSEVDAELATE